MTEITVILTGCLLTAVFIYLLYTINFSKEERYKQTWAPIAALVFGVVVIQLNLLETLPFLDILFTQFPTLEFYAALVVNLLILAVFLGIKTVLRLFHFFIHAAIAFLKGNVQMAGRLFQFLATKFLRLLPAFWRYRVISGNGSGRTISFVYEKGHRDITLKSEWLYPHIFFRYGAILAMFLFIMYILLIPFEWRTAFIDYLPAYPAVALLLFLEISWFFGGNAPTFRKGTFEGEDVQSRIKKNYQHLFHVYHEQWGERILVSGEEEINGLDKMNQMKAFSPLEDEKSFTAKRMKLITRRLRNTSQRNVKESYIEMVHSMIEGSSVLVEEPLYGEIKKYLIQGIISTLIEHEKVVFVARDDVTAQKSLRWLKQGMEEGEGIDYLWDMELFEKAYKDNSSPHILIITPQQLFQRRTLDFLTEQSHGSQYSRFILPETERLLAFHNLDFQRFAAVMADSLSVPPSYWIFSQWYEGLESAVRQTFQVKPKDLFIQSPQTPSLFYIVWKLEGDKRFQEKVFPELGHRAMIAEVVLGAVAQKYNAGEMQFVHQRALPTRESFEELAENEKMLSSFGLKGRDISRLKKHVQIYEPYWTVPQQAHSFLFVRDERKNLIDTLTYWQGNGLVTNFVQIISPPYLLRDYLAEGMQYHMSNNRAVASLPSKQPSTSFGKIKPLLDRLTNGEVEEAEVKKMLSGIDKENSFSTIGRLEKHLKDVFGQETDVLNSLQIRKQKIFNEQTHQFETQRCFRITEKLAYIYPRIKRTLYGIRTQTGELLDFIEEGQISQQYLPGQLHSFQGELYRIDALREAEHMLDVSYVPQKKYYQYIHENVINLMQGKTAVAPELNKEKTFPEGTVKRELGERPIQIRTKGFLTFENSIKFQQEMCTYTSLQPIPSREYQRGKYLQLTIQKDAGQSLSENVSFTIAFILNEMMKTLYPHTYPFLLVTTPLPKDFFEAASAMRLQQAFPLVQMEKEDKDQEVTLLFIEDSPTPMGMVESVSDYLDDIFELLDDYLSWLLENRQENEEYLRFGEEHLSALFDIEGAAALLASIANSSNSLKNKRTRYMEALSKESSKEEEAQGEMASCTFCDKEFYMTDQETLEDGRIRCRDCEETAVDEVVEAKRIYEQVRTFMQEEFDVGLRPDIDVKLVNSQTLHHASGLFFDPKSSSRIIGRAAIDEERNIEVLLENGAPQLSTYMTMIHELTHVWQFDELNYSFMTLEELEGFATWVELYFAEKMGELNYAEECRQKLRERQDAYWFGYIDLCESLEHAPPNIHHPFELYKQSDERRAVDY